MSIEHFHLVTHGKVKVTFEGRCRGKNSLALLLSLLWPTGWPESLRLSNYSKGATCIIVCFYF